MGRRPRRPKRRGGAHPATPARRIRRPAAPVAPRGVTADRWFRDLLESAPDPIIGVNARGRIVLVNAQTEKVFGYARAELMDQPVEILIPERVRGAHRQHRAGYLMDPRTRPMGVGLDLTGRRKDGSEFPAEISLSPLQTPDGLVVTTIVRDISDRKSADERFRGLMEAAPDAMVIVDADGHIALVNGLVEKLFGYRRNELIGRSIEILVPARYRRAHPEHRSRYFDDPRARPMAAGLDLHGLRKDGTSSRWRSASRRCARTKASSSPRRSATSPTGRRSRTSSVACSRPLPTPW